MLPIFWPTAFGASVNPNVKVIAIISATVSAPAKLPTKTSHQLRSMPVESNDAPLSSKLWLTSWPITAPIAP